MGFPMKHSVFLKLAASGLVLGVTAVGCKPATNAHPASFASVSPKAEKEAAKAAAAASAALKARKAGKAIKAAEKAVALSPRTASYRALLGQAYLQQGRFASAEQSLADAISLDPADGKSALSLSLAQISLGKWEQARATLAGARGTIPAVDMGLALALAGDRDAGVALLETAVRETGSDGKARQNLALGYALAGRWAESRLMAAQDVPLDELDARMTKWAKFAQPRAASDQVASLLGVTPASDPGFPTQLALMAAPAQSATVAPDAPQPSEVAGTELPAAPGEVRYVEPSAPEAPVNAADAAPASVATAAVPHAPAKARSGRYVVQLGAYSSANRVEIAWNRNLGRVQHLSEYTPSSSVVRKRTATMHRLAAAGFETRAEADKVCAQVKARGGQCFVRSAAGDAPVQWVSRASAAYAAR